MTIDNTSGKVCAVIVAAGRGTRMNMDRSKQYVDIAGKPVLARTIQTFEDCPEVEDIVVVANEQDLDYVRSEIIERYGFVKVRKLAAGGSERQDSVFNGLKQLDEKCDIVLIHDGARPFVGILEIKSVIEAAIEYGAACTAVPAKDTIKRADPDGFIAETPDRSNLWQVQTPQAFKVETIMEAYRKAYKDGFRGTDDSMLAERLGCKVKLVMGNYNNIKITTREDLLFAAAIAGEQL
jgi:2-C-methyl-D-erythritol 4-phosphate cytidylyltransferase